MLFVPGARPDRFEKASASGADEIVLDLEDGVAAKDKETARQCVADWIASGGRGVVRINPPGTDAYADDIATFAQAIGVGIMLPKATAQSTAAVARLLRPDNLLLPIIESAQGVFEAVDICSTPGVKRVAFGNGDLAADVGLSHDNWPGLQWARSTLVFASAAAGIAAPVDGVVTKIKDETLLAEECRSGRSLGFSGKLSIHPDQVAVINSHYSPNAAELEWAQRLLTQTANGGASSVDGEMVDDAILRRARHIATLHVSLEGSE